MTENAGSAEPVHQPFTPSFNYQWELGLLNYQLEDVSYRSDLIGRYASRMLHPHEDRLVGCQVWNVREVLRSLSAGRPQHEERMLTLGMLLSQASSMEAGSQVRGQYEPLVERFSMILIPEKIHRKILG